MTLICLSIHILKNISFYFWDSIIFLKFYHVRKWAVSNESITTDFSHEPVLLINQLTYFITYYQSYSLMSSWSRSSNILKRVQTLSVYLCNIDYRGHHCTYGSYKYEEHTVFYWMYEQMLYFIRPSSK